MKRSNESGSHLIGLALGLVAVGVMAFAGYRVWQMQQPGTSTAPAATMAVAPKTITNTASLNQSISALDQAATQVNSNLDDSGLNTDLNDML